MQPPIKRCERTYNAIEIALLELASVCDGAYKKDRAGFNGIDSQYGKSLAKQIESGKRLTFKQAQSALKMLKKYGCQLKRMGCNPPTMDDLNKNYQSSFRVDLLDGEIAVFMPSYHDKESMKLYHQTRGWQQVDYRPDGSYRYPLEYAYEIYSALPKEGVVQVTEEFLKAAIPPFGF